MLPEHNPISKDPVVERDAVQRNDQIVSFLVIISRKLLETSYMDVASIRLFVMTCPR